MTLAKHDGGISRRKLKNTRLKEEELEKICQKKKVYEQKEHFMKPGKHEGGKSQEI